MYSYSLSYRTDQSVTNCSEATVPSTYTKYSPRWLIDILLAVCCSLFNDVSDRSGGRDTSIGADTSCYGGLSNGTKRHQAKHIGIDIDTHAEWLRVVHRRNAVQAESCDFESILKRRHLTVWSSPSHHTKQYHSIVLHASAYAEMVDFISLRTDDCRSVQSLLSQRG